MSKLLDLNSKVLANLMGARVSLKQMIRPPSICYIQRKGVKIQIAVKTTPPESPPLTPSNKRIS